MKWIFRLLVLVMPLLLSGCIDIYQHVSLGTKGETNIYTRLTVSKAIMAMSSRMSGNTAAPDFDQLMPDGDWSAKEGFSDLGRVETGKINTDTDFGMYYKASVNYRNQTVLDKWHASEVNFFPFVENGKLSIKTSFPNQTDQSSNAMAAAFLSTAKYIVTIDKRVCPSLKTATVTVGDVETDVGLVDVGDEYFCSIPLGLLFYGDAQITLE
jgi:hypothetical protein